MTSPPEQTAVHPVVAAVTARVVDRSTVNRRTYLSRIDAAALAGPARGRLACSNLAHGFAAADPAAKRDLAVAVKPNVAIVSAYNDMLSAHQPFKDYPAQLKHAVVKAGGLAQFAGGVPAMCDGVTQGRAGMEISLFSRDVIAMATAVALSHDMFDGALLLGVCDKIVPGLLIGGLSFGHLPVVLVPAGPMTSGLANAEKSRVRQLFAEGLATREDLLAAEAASYHGPGTCTFYGTANSNQMLVEIMGLHLPGSSFVNPGTPLRGALTAEAGRRVARITGQSAEYTPMGRVVDEKAVVNGVVGLLATGGSTNHTLHLVAIAAAAGITLTWQDFADLSAVVPALARVYPNGGADVNHFHAAGGMAFLIGELLDAGLLHEDVSTVAGPGLQRYRREPFLAEDGSVEWRDGTDRSLDLDVLRPVADPFSPDGGVKVLAGRLGQAVAKTSAVAPAHRVVRAPAVVVDDQAELIAAFDRGELDRDLVAVVRYQGPRANGMPELHKLTPLLGVLQDRGHQVALVTDGRMSGASGKIPAAIHLTPEAAAGGLLARVRDGDMIVLDTLEGTLEIEVDDATLSSREDTGHAPSVEEWSGTGRELFNVFRHAAGDASTGASVFGLPAASHGVPATDPVRSPAP